MTVSDEFLRRTRDPVLLARAARIFRAARARADAQLDAGQGREDRGHDPAQ